VDTSFYSFQRGKTADIKHFAKLLKSPHYPNMRWSCEAPKDILVVAFEVRAVLSTLSLESLPRDDQAITAIAEDVITEASIYFDQPMPRGSGAEVVEISVKYAMPPPALNSNENEFVFETSVPTGELVIDLSWTRNMLFGMPRVETRTFGTFELMLSTSRALLVGRPTIAGS
jgi:hypothetical protein